MVVVAGLQDGLGAKGCGYAILLQHLLQHCALCAWDCS